MRIGDKVRFLSQTGGGLVVGFDKKGWALVEDEDGFEIPVPQKDCVVIQESVVGKESVSKTIQTRNGDKINLALVYNVVKVGEYECVMANESNYNLLATYTIIHKGEHTTVFAGEILPYERKLLFRFGKEALSNGSKKVQVRAIPFKRGDKNASSMEGEYNIYKGIDEKKTWQPKEIIEKEFLLDSVNLLKDSMFKENEYISGRGYVIIISKEGENNPDNFEAVKKELLDKFRSDIKEITPAPKPIIAKEDDSYIKIGVSGVMEVDLHAHELLDTTAGMGNAEILQYQLSKFNEIMVANLHKRGTRIVFIHGKGDGVLRNAILKELKTKYSRCTWQDASFKEYGFGATMVTVK